MRAAFEKLKSRFSLDNSSEENAEDYVEINPRASSGTKARVIVRPFVIEDFADIKPALDAIREGYTVAMLNIKPLRDKDLVELKRAVSKLKKTCEALEGDIAGVGEDWIVVTPSFASVYRADAAVELPVTEDRSQH